MSQFMLRVLFEVGCVLLKRGHALVAYAEVRSATPHEVVADPWEVEVCPTCVEMVFNDGSHKCPNEVEEEEHWCVVACFYGPCVPNDSHKQAEPKELCGKCCEPSDILNSWGLCEPCRFPAHKNGCRCNNCFF